MSKTYLLTEGNVTKLLLRFFFPMLLTNLLQQIYTVADTAIVGKGLGDNALAAVGNMSSLSLLIIGFSMGMTNGFSVPIAQYYGANEMPALRKMIALSLKLSGIITIVLTSASLVFLKPVMLLMKTADTIIDDSLLYGYIIFAGLFATIAYNLSSCILRALGDSKTPFIAIMSSSVMNVFLDWILIFRLRSGVEGAAFATIVSQAVSAVICFAKIRKIQFLRLEHDDFSDDCTSYICLLKNGIPMACMNSVTAVGCMVVQTYVNDLGVAYTSAYSACSKFLNLFMLPSVTAGFALSAFTSQNYGANKTERIREGVQVCVGIALVSYLILGTVMLLFPDALVRLMLNEIRTISFAAGYLRICGIMLFILNLLLIFRNCVQGMGYPLIPMCSGILEMALRIPMIMIFLPRIGFIATAYAETAAWTGALALNLVAYEFHMCKIQK